MKHILQLAVVLLALSASAQTEPPAPKPGKNFDQVADLALLAMTKRAEDLKIKGVAVVAYVEGETTKSWSSKMVVVGETKNSPTEENRGANLLAIAYSTPDDAIHRRPKLVVKEPE